LKTRGFLVRIGFALTERATAFFERATEERRAGFLDLIKVLDVCRFGKFVRDLAFGFEVRTLAAFRALALPAGERLVAGFRRVDFPAKTRLRDDDVAAEWREVERDVSLFTLLAIGLLMRKALVLKDH
jgi:hypothetical protein